MLMHNIKSAVIRELLRIIVFVIYYIALIAFGVAIILGLSWLGYYLITIASDLLFKINPYIIYLIVFAIIGLALLSIMLGIYLIKPLFAFKRKKNNNRIEIVEKECPLLFAMLRDVADRTGCKMPKHIYISPDVNACVFYDTSFWSIFFPIKKNLEIGLGLFDDTSIEEVKSIIAHEFGHFSQNSMKVGSTVYVTNTVLHDLIYAEDFWDRYLDKMCLTDNSIIRFFGVLTRGLTNVIKRMTFKVYKFVQKGYLKLSRYMEYEADNISCQCVGTSNFVSAMYKIELLHNKNLTYQNLLRLLISENKFPSNYFSGKKIAAGLTPHQLSYDTILTEPTATNAVKSRIRIEDVWSSHPAMEDRIENAKQFAIVIGNIEKPKPSSSLIPESLYDKVSTHYTSIIINNVEREITFISDNELKEVFKNMIEANTIDNRLQPFFSNNIVRFDIDKEVEIPVESPITETNARKIAEFTSHINDWNILTGVMNGEIDASEVQLDGIVYKKKKLPLNEFRLELDALHNEVVNIYSQIYAYISNRCDQRQKELFRLGFVSVFYAQDIQNNLFPQLFAHRNALLMELNRVTRRDEEEYYHLCSEVNRYESHLKRVISELDLEWIGNTFMNIEFANSLKEYASKEHTTAFNINEIAVNEMLNWTDRIDEMTYITIDRARHLICDIAKEILDKNYCP